jgi:hypothetical protein
MPDANRNLSGVDEQLQTFTPFPKLATGLRLTIFELAVESLPQRVVRLKVDVELTLRTIRECLTPN